MKFRTQAEALVPERRKDLASTIIWGEGFGGKKMEIVKTFDGGKSKVLSSTEDQWRDNSSKSLRE